MGKRTYDFVISLGSACQTAYQIKRHGLRQNSGPFDWVIIPCASLTEVLRQDFETFCSLPDLRIVDEKNGHYTVEDSRYRIRSMHDFHVRESGGDVWADYPAFREKMDRRISVFRRQLETAWSILFVQCGATKLESIALFEVLKAKRPGRRTELLVVSDLDEFDEDWQIPGITSRRIRMPRSAEGGWKGDGKDWHAALKGIALKKTSFRQLQDRIVCTRVYEKSYKLYDRFFCQKKRSEQ